MDGADDIAGMTVDTECRRRHRGGMAVGVAVEVGGMATGTDGAADDGGYLWPVGRVFQGRRRGVAVGAPVVMDGQRIIGRVAEGHAGRSIQDDAES